MAHGPAPGAVGHPEVVLGLMQAGGELQCWGRNNNGQLGYGDTKNRGDGGNGARLSAAENQGPRVQSPLELKYLYAVLY